MSDLADRPTLGRRPLAVTVLTGLVLILAVFNLARLLQATQKWSFLLTWLSFSPLYLVITGLVWGLAGLALAWGLWCRKTWAPLWTCVYFLAYSLYFWLDRFLLAGSAERNLNAWFAASIDLLVLVWLVWTLRRQKVKTYFGDKDEQKSKNTGAA
jgi:hypothetical protein